MLTKSAIVASLGLFAIQANADSGFYALGSAGVQHLRYDTGSLIRKKASEGNVPYYLEALDIAGGSVNTDTNLVSKTYKTGFGYAFSDKNAVELSYRRYSLNSISVAANIPRKTATTHQEYNGYVLDATASAAANASINETAEGSGIGLSYLRTIGNRFFVRLGVEHVNFSVNQNTTEHYDYSYNVKLNDQTWNRTQVFNQTDIRNKEYKYYVPLLGAGMNFPVSKSVVLRAEFEHVGIVKYGFDLYSVTAIYKF
jgi:hypothetical protein